MEAEALAQLETAILPDPYDWYEEGSATQIARVDYIRERLRLLYVGITRARRDHGDYLEYREASDCTTCRSFHGIIQLLEFYIWENHDEPAEKFSFFPGSFAGLHRLPAAFLIALCPAPGLAGNCQ